MANELLENALRYAEQGYHVFPVRQHGKEPATKNGFKDATTDHDQILKWWSENPMYNIGVATGQISGIFVIDVDADKSKGKTGMITFNDWQRLNGYLPDTETAISGSGGIHLFYKYDSSMPVKSRSGLYTDIDVRGDGGYIIVPPSIHPNGQPYQWQNNHSITAPDDTVKAFLRGAEKAVQKHTLNRSLTISQGNRTQSLVSLAGKLINTGLSQDAIRDALQRENEERCIPPLTAKELEREVFPVLTRGYTPTGDYTQTDLDQFHVMRNGEPVSVIDEEIFQYIVQHNNLIIVGSVPYWYRHGVYDSDLNGTLLKTEIKNKLYRQLIRSNTIDRIYKLFFMDATLCVNADDLNKYPQYWINFINGFYDPIEKKIIPHDPAYYAVNQIPHEYHPDRQPEGDLIESWLNFITPDPADREMLLQYCGYCMTTDTTQQKFMILFGKAGSGKSTVIRMIEAMIGSKNISNVSLKELTQRFASYGLMGKLLNSCADLEVSALEDVSLIKKILGEDSIRAEAKGKDAISFRNYAKLIFSTNELPLVLSEKTEGIYRRMLILRMDNIPDKREPTFLNGLMSQKEYFIRLCVEAVERMYCTGHITESNESVNAVRDLRNDSDTVAAWISDRCMEECESELERGFLYDNYSSYCMSVDRTPLSRQGFYRSLGLKGYASKRDQYGRYITGLALK